MPFLSLVEKHITDRLRVWRLVLAIIAAVTLASSVFLSISCAHETDSRDPGPRTNWCSVRVSRPDGTPAAHARLIVYRDARVVLVAEAGLDGIAKIPRGKGRAFILVDVVNAALHRDVIDLSDAEHKIELPLGEPLRGMVKVLEGRHSPRIQLDLNGWNEGPHLLRPASVRRAEHSWRASNLRVETRADDTFEITGLNAGRGQFVVQEGYHFKRSGDRTFKVRSGEKIIVPILQDRLIVGRVVWGPSGMPVPYAAVSVSAERIGVGAQTDGDGRFEVSLPWIARTRKFRVSAEVYGFEGSVSEREIDGGPGHLHEIGEIALSCPHRVSIRVLDQSGRAVRGAVATVGDPCFIRSAPTNLAGETAVWLPKNHSCIIRVGKIGFSLVQHRHQSESTEARVVLSKDSMLEIRVVNGEGVTIEGAGAIVPDGVIETATNRWCHRVLFLPNSATFFDKWVPRYDYLSDADGLIHVPGIKPGESFDVGVYANSFLPSWRSAPITVEPGELRKLEAVVPVKLDEVYLMVSTVDGGDPLAASVEVLDDLGYRLLGTSDASGRLRIQGIRWWPVNAWIESVGCEGQALTLASKPEGTVQVRLNRIQ